MKPEATKDQELLQKWIRGGRTNLSDWFEKIADEYCQEKVVEERVSVESIEKRFYTEFTEQFLCSLLNLLFKFLIDRGVGHIDKPRPSLIKLPTNTNWAKKQKSMGKIYCRKGVGVLLEQINRNI